MFMKKVTFAFFGLLACVLSVSCEDKLIDDEKKNTPDNTDGDTYISVLDSSFTYSDGILVKETRKSYTKNGLVERDINKEYDSDGSLTANEESVYTYSDSEGDNYVRIDSRNGTETAKEERYYSGNTGNSVTDRKNYVKRGGEWFLNKELYLKTENYRSRGYNSTYALYNGQRVPIYYLDYSSQLDPVTGNVLYSESITCNKSYNKDPSDPDGLTISALRNGLWRKTIRRNNGEGKSLYRENLMSTDSATWKSTGYTETKYDIKGNLVYEGYFYEDGIVGGKQYTTYSDDYRFISSCNYEFNKSGSDSVLSTYKKYYYSDAGVLDSAEMVFDMNMIAFLPLEMSHIESGIYLGVGQSNVAGAKCVIQFDANGNPVNEKLYRMDENGEIENKECVRSTLTYDSGGRRTGYVVNVLVDGNWARVETGNTVYDSQGRELSNHSSFTGLPEGAEGLKSEAAPSSYSQFESDSRKEYDIYGNVIYMVKEESYSMTYINFEDGNLNERSGREKTEEFYSTIKVK